MRLSVSVDAPDVGRGLSGHPASGARKEELYPEEEEAFPAPCWLSHSCLPPGPLKEASVFAEELFFRHLSVVTRFAAPTVPQYWLRNQNGQNAPGRVKGEG